MKNIGIVLPASTLYPSIGIDFFRGIKSCFQYLKADSIQFHTISAGFGVREEEIFRDTEKLLVEQDVDIIVAYCNDQVAQRLAPLISSSGKLLIVTHAGAGYPVTNFIDTPVLVNSLHHAALSFLTGKLAGNTGPAPGVLATSFYDGGYHHVHAMTNGFTLSGGELKYTFVSPPKKEDFEVDTLVNFLIQHPEVKKILGVFSGDTARLFYEKMAPYQEKLDLQLYGSPMMFDKTPGDFPSTKLKIQRCKGYACWLPQLDNQANVEFRSFYNKHFKAEPSLFSMQGWENALLAMEYLQFREELSNIEAIEGVQKINIDSPRGTINVNDHHVVVGPAYEVEASGEFDIQLKNVLPDLSHTISEMIANIPDTPFSTWRNTYLCI